MQFIVLALFCLAAGFIAGMAVMAEGLAPWLPPELLESRRRQPAVEHVLGPNTHSNVGALCLVAGVLLGMAINSEGKSRSRTDRFDSTRSQPKVAIEGASADYRHVRR